MRTKSTPVKAVKFQSNPESFGLSTIDEDELETSESETMEEISTWDGRYDLVSLIYFLCKNDVQARNRYKTKNKPRFPKVVLYAVVALVVWRVAYCIYYGEAFAQNVLHNLRKIQADMFTRDELTLLLIGFAAIYYRL